MKHLLILRKAVLTALKADAGLIAIVPAKDIHPQQPRGMPDWPFVRYGVPSAVPREAACLNGSEVSFTVHGFAKDRYAGGLLAESAEDHALRIGAAIHSALHRKRLAIPNGHIRIRSVQGRVQVDGATEGAFHAIGEFTAKVNV